MRALFSAAFIAAALMSSLSAFAETGTDRTYCGSIRDQNQCANSQGCFWDQDDNRCESRGVNDLCGLAHEANVCMLFSRVCFWDFSDNRCEMR